MAKVADEGNEQRIFILRAFDKNSQWIFTDVDQIPTALEKELMSGGLREAEVLTLVSLKR